MRAQAAQAFPDGLICDPGFDVLLDLFIASEEGDRRVISDLLKTEVPATTGLRWLKRLEDEGFVERQPDPHDRRRSFITLSEESRSKVRNLIEQSRLQLTEYD
ncbi:MarR family transcriptional regulator [uncultured Sphingomonas sp.]|uniref:MarR family transcriptional regulator n=1 Tax=uncultured Sphingomonas sp. TaxID=158754 RepID=UPI0025EA5F71|nr:MarR family transcriptional regulator [uncultured Sphingomonas sp.]